ncbi:SOS response-associated peptidase [Salinifilum aidingensis]
MCGRYASTKGPAALAREFAAVDATGGAAPGADFNVAPTKEVLGVAERPPRQDGGGSGEREVRVLRWGLVPHWAKDPAIGNRMINAKAETVTDKPAFRAPIRRNRCLVPADGWYEWQPTGAGKQPYFMTTGDGSSLALAGIWSVWRDPSAAEEAPPLVTCSVLTTRSVGRLRSIHERMPLLLPAGVWGEWLDPEVRDVSDLLGPPAEDFVDELVLRPVSTRVNNVRNNGPELVERVRAADAG